MSWDLYRAAIVTVPATTAWVEHELVPRAVGTTVGDFPFAAPAHFITAYNPGGSASDFDNAKADAALLDYVLRLGLVFFRSIGSDRSHDGVEPGFGIVGLSRDEAIGIGNDFGQDAIYEWHPEALEILACRPEDAAESTTHGWLWHAR
jgi:hypothetical protein